jgi:hypothetical protein
MPSLETIAWAMVVQRIWWEDHERWGCKPNRRPYCAKAVSRKARGRWYATTLQLRKTMLK